MFSNTLSLLSSHNVPTQSNHLKFGFPAFLLPSVFYQKTFLQPYHREFFLRDQPIQVLILLLQYSGFFIDNLLISYASWFWPYIFLSIFGSFVFRDDYIYCAFARVS
jgi:hypothetical protein